MTPEQINQRIAEKCGPIWGTSGISSIPNYFSDLNAMHEVECQLTVGNIQSYVDRLLDLTEKTEKLNYE